VRRRILSAASVLALIPVTGSTAGAAPAATAPADAWVETGALLTYRAAPGQVNRPVIAVTTEPDPNFVRFVVTIDDIVPISPGTGCARPGTDLTVVICRYSEQQEDAYGMVFLLGDRADRWDRTTGISGRVHGGPGDDVLTGGGLFGDAGNDVLTGSDRTDHDGHDRLDGGDGTDVIQAGRGNDLVIGGRGNDRLYGNSGDDVMFGNSGNDDLRGGPGQDRISGGSGKNQVRQD
jgi:serralysin